MSGSGPTCAEIEIWWSCIYDWCDTLHDGYTACIVNICIDTVHTEFYLVFVMESYLGALSSYLLDIVVRRTGPTAKSQ